MKTCYVCVALLQSLINSICAFTYLYIYNALYVDLSLSLYIYIYIHIHIIYNIYNVHRMHVDTCTTIAR